MKIPRLHYMLLFFSGSFSLAQAETIISIGMSNQAGGMALNKEMALARANDFLAEQANIAHFRYRRDKDKLLFERILKTDLRNVKMTKSETFAKNGVIIWLKADVTPPRFADEDCQSVKVSVAKGEQTNQIVMDMLEKSIPELLKRSIKTAKTVTGVSYLRKLSITKSLFGKFSLQAKVCVAQLKSSRR